jgi:uncharacterized protein DUF3108
MKKPALFIVALLFVSNLSFAQCNKIFDFQEGTSWQWTNYDKKGKFLGKSMQKIEKFNEVGDGFEVTMSMVQSDKKGDQSEPVSLDMACKNGVIYFDMKKYVPAEYLKGDDGEVTVEVTGDNLEMPANLKAGDYLRDASVTMNLGGSGSPMGLTMTVEIFDRKVESEENLNTPAGNFDCFIITQTIKTKALISMQMASKEWYSPGVGMVKSESYRKGKLMGYTILTQFSK